MENKVRDYENDLFGLAPLIRHGKDYYFFGCDKIGKNTNERLKEIFKKFDFQQKEVFSVLASGDQPFSAYYLGAKNVDTFDNNWTTYYNFYLRKWYMMYYHNCFLKNESEVLLKALSMHDSNCEEERKVYEVWKEILLKYNNISNMFWNNHIYEWNIPYIYDWEKFINIIKDKQANFNEVDICQEMHIDKRYDIVILSNILENIYLDSDINLIISQNLRNILRDNGIVICSILNDGHHEFRDGMRRKGFDEHFIYEVSEIQGYNNYLKRVMPLYYTYRKIS